MRAITKVSVLKDLQKELKQAKKIELKMVCMTTNPDERCWETSQGALHTDWKNIVLLMQNWRGSGYDLMLAYDNNNSSCLYLGHFNDGIV